MTIPGWIAWAEESRTFGALGNEAHADHAYAGSGLERPK